MNIGAATLDALLNTVADAEALALRHSPAHADKKAHQDYVTDVDLAVDAFLQDALELVLPGVPVLSEERAHDSTARLDRYWIIDPIDGTGNLIAGLPFVGISVALVDQDGPCLSAVCALGQGITYAARRGYGALRVQDGVTTRMLLPDQPSELLVISTGLLDRLMEGTGTRWKALRAVGKIRNLGAQALHLCGVAAGQFAGVASIEAKIWDEVAAGLIIREAGGVWRSTADGDDVDWCNPASIMALGSQNSLACHPVADPALSAALDGILGA
ncbi:inositol monophosphatase family protein [Sulfitobacter sp. SK012]|uniref:inositol monophosphatase family protein n=1 Tax=Sulfitobacter sp. SK012 TaxID=1389005 RepID=UPI0013B43EFA|nr:inositol monophosphatase family protein [Sulfitobacter sp. SK012]